MMQQPRSLLVSEPIQNQKVTESVQGLEKLKSIQSNYFIMLIAVLFY